MGKNEIPTEESKTPEEAGMNEARVAEILEKNHLSVKEALDLYIETRTRLLGEFSREEFASKAVEQMGTYLGINVQESALLYEHLKESI